MTFELIYPERLPTILSYDHYLGAVLGVILNCLVVTGLNLKRSRKLGKYRWFMMAHSINDLFSAISMGMLEVCFDYSFNTFIMLVDGPLTVFGTIIGKTCFMVFASGFILNIMLLALTFVHRYFQICKEEHLYKFSQKRYIALTAFIIVAPLVILDFAMIFAYTFSYEFTIRSGSEVYGVRALYVEDLMGPAFLVTCAVFVGMTTLSYTIVFVCCRAIFNTLQASSRSMSERTKKQQKMLTIVLLLQSITPVFTSSLPAVGMLIGILLQFKGVRWITWTMTVTFVWLPTLNATISLSCIAPLRSMFTDFTGMRIYKVKVQSGQWAPSTGMNTKSCCN